MTFKESYLKATDWKRRITLVSLYHSARLSKNKSWKLSDSAKYFGISIGLISESLTLCKHFDEIKDCNSRNEALKRIKK